MPDHNPNSLAILIAEDDPDDCQLTLEAFSECRLLNPVYFVSNGVELLDFLHRRGAYAPPAKAPRPGLILLDLNMPKKDGREALAEIKSDADLRTIPVVVLTTSNAETDILQSYKLGGNSFICKPVRFDALVEVVKSLGKYWFEIVDLPKQEKP